MSKTGRTVPDALMFYKIYLGINLCTESTKNVHRPYAIAWDNATSLLAAA
jgi:hypothetical protein